MTSVSQQRLFRSFDLSPSTAEVNQFDVTLGTTCQPDYMQDPDKDSRFAAK